MFSIQTILKAAKLSRSPLGRQLQYWKVLTLGEPSTSYTISWSEGRPSKDLTKVPDFCELCETLCSRPCEGFLWASSYEWLVLVRTAAWLRQESHIQLGRDGYAPTDLVKLGGIGWSPAYPFPSFRVVLCSWLSRWLELDRWHFIHLWSRVGTTASSWFHKGHWSSPGHFFLQKAPQPP